MLKIVALLILICIIIVFLTTLYLVYSKYILLYYSDNTIYFDMLYWFIIVSITEPNF